MISNRKKLVFAGLVTFLFCVGLEASLWLLGVQPVLPYRDPFVGFEESMPLFVQPTDGDESILQTAENKLAYFNQQQFARSKPRNTYRVFCVGGSTTYGQPYDDSTSYVAWLREFLKAGDGRLNWEVINAGGISYASYRVANLVDELCSYQPDLFVIYTAHNEFLEERSYRDLKSESSLVRWLSKWLYTTRTFSLAKRWSGSPRLRDELRSLLPAEVDAILDGTAGPDSYQRDAGLQAAVLEHYEFNVRRMIQQARKAGAAVILISPASNLKDFSPFKSDFLYATTETQQTEWLNLYLQATEFEQSGQLEQGLAKAAEAVKLDAGRADGHFLLGRLLMQLNRVTEAEQAFENALRHDVCPLRAIPQLRSSLEKIALATRTPLVDFYSIVRNDCLQRIGHGVPGNEYFVDHVHPNIETHRLLGLALMQALIEQQIAQPAADWRERELAEVSRLIESRVDVAMQARALTNLAQVLSWAGKPAEAGPIAAQAVQLRRQHGLPDNAESLFYLAVHLETQQAADKAAAIYEQILEQVPEHHQARLRLATIYFDQSAYAEARQHFEELVRLQPTHAASQHMLGLTLAKLGEHSLAIAALQRARELDPDNAAIVADLEAAQRSN